MRGALPLAAALATVQGAMPAVTIAPGVDMPYVSLGTGSGMHHASDNVTDAVRGWIGANGTAIDTAYIYHDQAEIARGIGASGVSPTDLFLTSKILCSTYDDAKASIEANLRQLNVQRVDLMLIHFPKCYGAGSIAETWRALEGAQSAGLVRAIGVSNFKPADLEALRRTAKLWPPAINQCSMSVGYHDDVTIQYCDTHRIVYMAYSPLCGGSKGSSCKHGSVMDLPAVKEIAAAHTVSPAQIALKWIVQQRRPLATTAVHVAYMVADMDLWSWGELSDGEMGRLGAAVGSWVDAEAIEPRAS